MNHETNGHYAGSGVRDLPAPVFKALMDFNESATALANADPQKFAKYEHNKEVVRVAIEAYQKDFVAQKIEEAMLRKQDEEARARHYAKVASALTE